MQIVCPTCDVINRVSEQQLQDDPHCGKCSQALFSKQAIPLSGLRLQHHLTHNDIPVLVDFWASWCGPCKMLSPLVAEASKELEPRLRLIQVDTEAERDLLAQYGVRGLPTLLFFTQGRELDRVSGVMEFSNLLSWIRAHM